MRKFQFIPVLDLKGGTTVYAVKGNRATYRPLKSPLIGSSDPVSVAKALIGATGAQKLYIADLDAIEGRGDNKQSISDIQDAISDVTLMVDPGIQTLAECEPWFATSNLELVIATETMEDPQLLENLNPAQKKRTILSLDFDQTGFRGHLEILNTPNIWPERIIAMTLSKVGNIEGPDIDLMNELSKQARDKKFFAAGGLRSIDDARQLANAGASGILAATAFHKKLITQKEIAAFNEEGDD